MCVATAGICCLRILFLNTLIRGDFGTLVDNILNKQYPCSSHKLYNSSAGQVPNSESLWILNGTDSELAAVVLVAAVMFVGSACPCLQFAVLHSALGLKPKPPVDSAKGAPLQFYCWSGEGYLLIPQQTEGDVEICLQ